MEYDFTIRCTAECADTCRAQERGITAHHDADAGRWYPAVGHDTPECDGFFGAWWQVFGDARGYATEQEARAAVPTAFYKLHAYGETGVHITAGLYTTRKVARWVLRMLQYRDLRRLELRLHHTDAPSVYLCAVRPAVVRS